MAKIEIKNPDGEVVNVIDIPNEEEYAELYRTSRDNCVRLEECIKVLSEIIDQQKIMKMNAGLNLIPILATITDCDRDSTDLLLKPLAKACRKALHRNEVARDNYYKMARKYIDSNE